ncbi:fatty-acid amide hydrolase 2 [Monomorium pharaonis]|uniref:fatty-acid amide hydrolase 2 n=1 Tax=Monomorium pharaonis TaxID=307658 RepID=UPI00063F8511|nr:fatty-acid amide hydrolase 2 [Monomorium pharaonis]XP_012527397.1 fatty-acid amide hydrolase 2 [Monomorium pharaonis]XP_012527398.1 fatty-acid amide hydrolase 2 [Monomorium pharaonis]
MCTSVKNKDSPQCQDTLQHVKKLCWDLLRCIIVQLHFLFDSIIDFAFSIYYDKKAKKVPPVKNKLLLESAVSLAEKIRTKKITSEEIVKAYIERCKEINSLINAIVETRYLDAIEEAKGVDAMIEQNIDLEKIKITQPFLGVPFTTKESNRVKGLVHSMGLLCRRNHRAEEDATAVRYLKEAGGILIATTNVPELNLWCESRNNLYGQTNNPYNITRTVGGSSGGEGAILTASGAPFSITSDIGGSTRMPAFFNGLFGHKPSEGLTPMAGIGLREKDYPDTIAAVGPLCRKTEDLTPFLKVLIGPNVTKLKLDEVVNVKNLKVFYQESSGDLKTSKVNRTMRATLMKAVLHFKELTGSATKIKIPGSEHSLKLWRYCMSCEDVNFKLNITDRKYVASACGEIYNLLTGNSQLTFAAIMKLIEEDFLPRENTEWAKNVLVKAKQFLAEKLGDNGVLFYPSAPFPASYHYSAFLRPFNFVYWGLFNALRFPTCQVPLGLDEEGLPVGIQVVAAPYNDHLCFAVAKELEAAFGGWVPPS